MADQPASLHRDADGKLTSAEYGDDGAGVDRWLLWSRNAELGELADAAEEDPTVPATALARLASIAGALRVADEALLKAEDTAAFSGDAGVAVLAVRRDTTGAGVGADGDYTNLQTDSLGRLRTVTPTVRGGGTGVTASSGEVANATATATMAAPGAGVTNYLTGLIVTSSGATAATAVPVTVTGTITGSLAFVFAVPAGVDLGATPLVIPFPEPVPASAANTAITATMPALGAGHARAAIVLTGFTR